MAASLLAVKHFNDRDASVVPELADYTDCAVQFDWDDTVVFDSGVIGYQAGIAFQQAHLQRGTSSSSCRAMVGTMTDFPALQLSTLAATSAVPLVVNRALDRRVTDPTFSPYTVQMFPHVDAMAEQFAQYLQRVHGRNNYWSILYAASDNGLQKLQAVSVALDAAQVRWTAHAYVNPQQAQFVPQRSIYQALQQVKATGHRTIVVIMENPYVEIDELARAADVLANNTALQALIQGSAWLAALDPFFLAHDQAPDKFLEAWRNQTADFAYLVHSFNPITGQHQVGYQAVNATFFQQYDPEYASSFAYDTVMAVGMGACAALDALLPTNSTLSVNGFVSGIQSVSFTGASGHVEFGQEQQHEQQQQQQNSIGQGDHLVVRFRNHSRNSADVTWCGYNILPQPDVYGPLVRPIWAPDIRFPNRPWQRWPGAEFYYANNGTTPAEVLRDERFENYLSTGVKAFGATLLAISLLTAIASALWVYLHSKHRVLLAAQPPFLYCLCTGAVILSLTIVPLSVDEGSGWDTDQLSHACMAIPWLFTTGYLVTYGALFSKLWRINKVLQFTRRQVKVQHVAWPSVVFLLSAVVVLILWTAIDSLQWVRFELDDGTGQTVGRCKSENIACFVVPLMTIMLIPSLLTEFMAWKTKDIDDAYSESIWIFVMVLVQLEVVLFSVPTLVILSDQSTTANYVGIVLICWVFPMSSMVLVMLPKFIAYYKAVKGATATTRTRGSSGGQVHVTGVLSSPGRHENGNGVVPSKPSVDSETMVAAQLAMRPHNSTVIGRSEAGASHSLAFTPEHNDEIPANDTPQGANAEENPPNFPSAIRTTRWERNACSVQYMDYMHYFSNCNCKLVSQSL